MLVVLFHYCFYRCSDTAVGHLYAKQGTDGGGNVSHVYRVESITRFDVPTHEKQRDMCIIRIPYAVVGTTCFIRSVNVVPAGLHDELNVTAAQSVVTIDGTFAHIGR